MGIDNIQILTQPDDYEFRMQLAVMQEVLMQAHRRGEHVYGSKRQECPLCQAEN